MKRTALLLTLISCLAAVQPVHAGITDFWRPKGRDEKLTQKIKDCELVIKEFTDKKTKDVVSGNILKDAKAVLIFTDSIRAGLGITGQYAQGVAMVRGKFGGWSAPAFFRMSGIGVGLQIGGEVGDVVMVVKDEKGLNQLFDKRFTMGADASAAAGKSGRQVQASTNAETHFVSYGRTKGLFAGMSFDGAVIKQDAGANKKYYGKEIDARDILLNGKAPVTKEAANLISTLSKHD